MVSLFISKLLMNTFLRLGGLNSSLMSTMMIYFSI